MRELVATHDKDYVDQVFRVMCHYYLPPCGNFSHTHPPTSIYQVECSQEMSRNMADCWNSSISISFMNCYDTFQLIFPLPNCCTGAGILAGSGDKASSSVVSITMPRVVLTHTTIIGTPTPIIGRFKQVFQVTRTKLGGLG